MESWSIYPVVPIKLCLRVVLGHIDSSVLLWMQLHRPPRSCGAHRGLGQEWKEASRVGVGPAFLGLEHAVMELRVTATVNQRWLRK